jgi:hypothetical protein
LKTKESRETANAIVRKIVKLAQDGNANARELLEEDLRFVCEDWITQQPELRSYRIAADSLKTRIRACIYNHKCKNNSNFFTYLFFDLKMSAGGLPDTRAFEECSRSKKDKYTE